MEAYGQDLGVWRWLLFCERQMGGKKAFTFAYENRIDTIRSMLGHVQAVPAAPFGWNHCTESSHAVRMYGFRLASSTRRHKRML